MGFLTHIDTRIAVSSSTPFTAQISSAIMQLLSTARVAPSYYSLRQKRYTHQNCRCRCLLTSCTATLLSHIKSADCTLLKSSSRATSANPVGKVCCCPKTVFICICASLASQAPAPKWVHLAAASTASLQILLLHTAHQQKIQQQQEVQAAAAATIAACTPEFAAARFDTCVGAGHARYQEGTAAENVHCL